MHMVWGLLCLLKFILVGFTHISLQWRHIGHDGVLNHQPHHCLLNRLFRRRSKKTSKLRVTVLCAGNSPVTGEFPAKRASNAENVSIWWRHHIVRFRHCHSGYHPNSIVPVRTPKIIWLIYHINSHRNARLQLQKNAQQTRVHISWGLNWYMNILKYSDRKLARLDSVWN